MSWQEDCLGKKAGPGRTGSDGRLFLECVFWSEGMNARGALICISQRPQRQDPLQIDLELYKSRHPIENFFCKLKEFKRISLRADKTDTSFEAMIYATAALINSK